MIHLLSNKTKINSEKNTSECIAKANLENQLKINISGDRVLLKILCLVQVVIDQEPKKLPKYDHSQLQHVQIEKPDGMSEDLLPTTDSDVSIDSNQE